MISYQFPPHDVPHEYPEQPSHGGGSMALYDEGILLGDIDEIDFLGDGVSAAIVGTKGNITISSSSPSGIFPIMHSAVALILDETHYTVIFDTLFGAVVQCQLPDATLHEGRIYEIKNGGPGGVSINANFGQLIDGFAPALVLLGQNDASRVQSDGINWFVLG